MHDPMTGKLIRESKPDEVGNILESRQSTHGDFGFQSAMAQKLKKTIRQGEKWGQISPPQRESLEMILVKVSRIVNGNPKHKDHWDDIGGYARQGKEND
jgi:hypothetical protein